MLWCRSQHSNIGLRTLKAFGLRCTTNYKYRMLANIVEIRWSHMTTKSHVFKASLRCSPSNKLTYGLKQFHVFVWYILLFPLPRVSLFPIQHILLFPQQLLSLIMLQQVPLFPLWQVPTAPLWKVILFLLQQVRHCMCHFYFFFVAHITNAKICSRYMTWRMTLLKFLLGFVHHFLHCVQWNLTVIYRRLL